ncbi:MAG: RNA-binding protein [Verrucomicrobia bacterium]|nr:RNA-binding protein [Verrucomicrobiota bacterium]
MSSDSHSPSRRGRRRRGGHRRPRSERPSGADSAATASSPSLWQRIVSFFSSKKTKAPAPRGTTSHPAYANNNGSNTPPERRTQSGPQPARFAAAKPEPADVTTPRLYVGNLSFDATDEDITNLFKGVGKVASAEVVTHRNTDRSKGFAFVQMQTVDEARRAVAELHDRPFMGRPLKVSGAKAVEPRQEAA